MNTNPTRRTTASPSRPKDGPDSTPPRRIEVSISLDEAGKRIVSLEDMTFGPGVGWYVQKTIRLDPQQVEALLRSLCCARQASACPASGCAPPAPVAEASGGDGAKILHILRADTRREG